MDFNSWGKLPTREPFDRIARVGQGFSRMLSQVKPEQYSTMTMSKGVVQLSTSTLGGDVEAMLEYQPHSARVGPNNITDTDFRKKKHIKSNLDASLLSKYKKKSLQLGTTDWITGDEVEVLEVNKKNAGPAANLLPVISNK